MISSGNASTVFIDSFNKTVHCYSVSDGGTVHDLLPYNAVDFTPGFYTDLASMLLEFQQRHPAVPSATYNFILPDQAIVTDVLSIPTMNSRAMKNAVNATLEGLFKNRRELTLCNFCCMQNKQISVYSVAGVQSGILSAIRSAADTAHIPVSCFSFAAETSAIAAGMLNPKLRSNTYLLLDIKEHMTRMIFVSKGISLGSAVLPFGYRIMEKHRLLAEETLFDHSLAELAVANARARAKAKNATLIGSAECEVTENDAVPGNSEEINADPLSETDDLSADNAVTPTGNLPKKAPRKLPKTMIRPEPTSQQGYADENFRIIAKWALCYLQESERLQPFGAINTVYVNLPDRLLSSINAFNAEGSGSTAARLVPAGFGEAGQRVGDDLELYGGLYVGKAKNQFTF